MAKGNITLMLSTCTTKIGEIVQLSSCDLCEVTLADESMDPFQLGLVGVVKPLIQQVQWN